MLISPPTATDHGFYSQYISLAPNTDLLNALQENISSLNEFAATLTQEQLLYRYAPGKWDLKETFQHLVDAERNFCYRIMRLSRGDQGALPMYNMYEFVINSFASEREMTSIMEELNLLRKASIAMFAGMNAEMLDRTGPARDVIISVRALGFAMVGHVTHHVNIIREKYLQQAIAAPHY